MVEGSSRTAFSCNFLRRAEMVYTNDPSIDNWFEQANTVATKDQRTRAADVLDLDDSRPPSRPEASGDQARHRTGPTEYLSAAHSVAHTEIIRRGECVRAGCYLPRDRWKSRSVSSHLSRRVGQTQEPQGIDDCASRPSTSIWSEHHAAHLKPLLDYLKKENRVVPLSEISDHFAFSQVYPWHLESACEWLERKGRFEKLSAPFKLTKRSQEEVEEPAYFFTLDHPYRRSLNRILRQHANDDRSARGPREQPAKCPALEIPRDKLIVVTGVSGSGKSSLAFDTLYAEGQRRLLASMSTFAKRFVGQFKKPDVDFVNGLSPVVSIDQKTVGSNPRSTVGTMTDISDYLRMLFATMGTPHCPLCEEPIAIRSPHQMMEHMLSLPAGTEVEVRAPVYKIYGEDYEYLFEQIRVNGYRRAESTASRAIWATTSTSTKTKQHPSKPSSTRS